MQPHATYTTADVINTFLRDFAPVVSALPGFEEYLGSIVNNSYNFFFNVFETTATDAVRNFYQTSVLSGQISPVIFFAGTYYFYFFSMPQVSVAGRYLSVRYWELLPGATYSTEDVLNAFKEGFAPQVITFPGFREYAGISLTGDSNHVLFYNVFDTLEEATAANTAAKSFVASGPLASQIQLVIAFTSAAVYDITCPCERTTV